MNPEREAMIQLISIGELGKSGLNTVADGDIIERDVIRAGSVILDAYGAVLMRKYIISRSELLPPDKVSQLAKDCLEGKYKFPGTK